MRDVTANLVWMATAFLIALLIGLSGCAQMQGLFCPPCQEPAPCVERECSEKLQQCEKDLDDAIKAADECYIGK